VSQGWWTEAQEKEQAVAFKKEVLRTFNRSEKLPKPKLGEMFNDVWAPTDDGGLPEAIIEQRSELGRLLKKYGGTWEPWKRELRRFVEEGEDVMDCDAAAK
jgi:2-oxoisovalerate dehydrogenase E1 component alpha subunit